jgi:putative heme iron utilization protein
MSPDASTPLAGQPTGHLMGDDAPVAPASPPAPSHAMQARSLVAGHDRGSLATLDADGHPFGSVALYVLDDQGQPVSLLSELAEHTRNVRRDGRASLLVSAGVRPDDDVMAIPRVTLLGSLTQFAPTDAGAWRERFLAAHPSAESYVSFGDFGWWRLDVSSVRFVGGYGRMSWVDAAAYLHAEVDPLAWAADGIVAHMNEDHADANLAYAQALLGISDATFARMVAVDRFGMELVVVTPTGLVSARCNFDEPASDPDAVRGAVIALLRRARGA